MKATLKILKDFYNPLTKKMLVATDSKKNSVEIDVDADGQPLHSFWFGQLKDSPEYFELVLPAHSKEKSSKEVK